MNERDLTKKVRLKFFLLVTDLLIIFVEWCVEHLHGAKNSKH